MEEREATSRASRTLVCVRRRGAAPSNTPDRPRIVPAICVSMVTGRVGAGGKVWRNLPDNPEGQHAATAHSITQCSPT